MPVFLAIAVFAVSLAATLLAAATFARRLERVARRIGLAEAVIGLLTAFAADGPEIVSALVALGKGAGDTSLGVLVGASIFNLAAMLGLSALATGAVLLRREALALEGAVALFAVTIAALLVFGVLPAIAACLLFAAVFVPYVCLLVRGRVPRRLRLHRRGVLALERALHTGAHAAEAPDAQERGVWGLAALIPVDVAAIVAGSFGMVAAALSLAHRWGAPEGLVGLLVLAPLAGLPNAYTGVRLGLARRGEAVVSETFNSNTLNLLAGVVLPALVVSVASPGAGVEIALAWLLGATAAALCLLAQRDGLGRVGGAALLGLYAVFAVLEIAVR